MSGCVHECAHVCVSVRACVHECAHSKSSLSLDFYYLIVGILTLCLS